MPLTWQPVVPFLTLLRSRRSVDNPWCHEGKWTWPWCLERKASLLNKNRTSTTVCHVEAIRQELVVQIFNCFLQGDDVPLHRNVFFDSSFFSASRSFCAPIADEWAHQWSKRYSSWDGECFFSGASRHAGLALLHVWQCGASRKSVSELRLHPSLKNHPVWTRRLPRSQIRFLHQGTARIVVWERCQTVSDW